MAATRFISTLTTGADAGAEFVGTAKNDIFVANLATNPANGLAAVETLNALDTLDGGAGRDTLNYFTDNGEALPGATLKNIEVINVVSGAAATADVSGSNITGVTELNARATGAGVDLDTKSNVTSISVTGTASSVDIDDAGTGTGATADKLAKVSISGNTGGAATIDSDVLTTLSLANSASGATVSAAAATRALTLNLNEVTGGTVADATATTLNVNATGKASTGVTVNAGAATAVTLNADEALTVASLGVGAAKNITVAGDSAVTISAGTFTALEAVDASKSTGGVTITPALGTNVTFTGGAGKDSIDATGTTKVLNLGAGDDTLRVTAALGTGGSVEGGEGTDTLSFTGAVAETLSATDVFSKSVSGFEKVSIGSIVAGQTDTINLANLDNINYVVTQGTVAVAPVAQVTDVNISGSTSDGGDSVTLNIDGTPFTTPTGIYADGDAIEAALVAIIDASPAYNAAIVGGALRITAAVAGTPFTVGAASITNEVGGTADVAPIATATPVTANNAGTPGGALVLNNLLSGGTVEFTGAIAAASTINVKDAASGSADVVNIRLNGTSNIVNTAALNVASVETINITATDSSADKVTLTNPGAASQLNLNAADATSITVSGNHGVDFTGSTFTKVTSFDASGVVATGATAGATADQIGTAGAVTFATAVTDKAVTITGGNGADVLSAASLTDTTAKASATINGGAGNDTITGGNFNDTLSGGEGKDTITGGLGADTLSGGAGNDTFVYNAVAESTVAARDVITDFQANTFGNGAAGAAGTGAGVAASRTGDVIRFDVDLGGAITNGAKVGVLGSAVDAQTFIQNTFADATTGEFAAALDSSTGTLYIDANADGNIDSVITLTGVTTLTAAAFELV